MKKLLLTLVLSAFYISSASAVSMSVGVSGQAGIFAASAKESTGTKQKGSGSEHGSAGWGSIFLEGQFNKLIIGVDYVPGALETDTTETAKSDKGVTAVTPTTVTNKIQVDFENLTTVYIGAMLNDNFYVKAGGVAVDVITNESLGTGASYGNTDLSGTMLGIGYHNSNDNGTFFRFEGNYMSFDGTSLKATGTAADNTIELKNLDGVSGKISLGKTF
tara:strand:+ start:433 stop:1086 length:654 start_codon:yes stop_codon:yes gene_type:complete